MIWGRLINWSMRYRFVRNRFWAWSISCMPFVYNFSNVTGVVVSSMVSDNLGATIRKKYTILS